MNPVDLAPNPTLWVLVLLFVAALVLIGSFKVAGVIRHKNQAKPKPAEWEREMRRIGNSVLKYQERQAKLKRSPEQKIYLSETITI